ncbi:MAG: hypothetical protein Q9159_006045 [Coniocarpon cinnabarinum]
MAVMLIASKGRLVRLIPSSSHDPSRRAIRDFFNYRLAPDPTTARAEWLDIVEARHTLWDDIHSAKKELIRSFLNLVNLEIVKRARPTSVFNFGSASVGNLFLTGYGWLILRKSARLFSGSFEAAIYLLSSICSIPQNVAVLPAINTNFSHHICAGLVDGTHVPGQNNISHPSDPTSTSTNFAATAAHRTLSSPIGHASDVAGEDADARRSRSSLDHADTIEDANWPGSLPVLRKPYISFTKSPAPPPAPTPPDSFTTTLESTQSHDSDTIIASPSSTTALSAPAENPAVLPAPIERVWYINPYGQEIRPYPNASVISALQTATSIVYSIGSLYTSLIPSLILRGVGAAIAMSASRPKILILNGSIDRETSSAHGAFTALDFISAIVRALRESSGIFDHTVDWSWKEDVKKYVTHLIYIDEDGAPMVDPHELRELGVECVRAWGRRDEDGGWRYDGAALAKALEAIIGTGRARSRRSTLIG